ncbi:MAG: glycosyltransferase family 2 protein, partial [Rhodospirillales bacterium]|nr:glycosyltransferase family 2 protein [Rhodospirillales bacterium]
MKIGCVLMQKNEVNALEPWLLYHAYLFGMRNLCVIDHGSTHPKVLNTLSWYEQDGLRVVRLPAEADFGLQGEFMTNAMRVMDEEGDYDFLLPIDCDEFLAVRREDGSFTCNKKDILDELANYAGRTETLEIKQNLLNILGHPNTYWALPYQKVFFSGGNLGLLCHGSHEDISG